MLLLLIIGVGQTWAAADLTISADFSSSNVFNMNTSGNDASSRTDMSDGTYTYYFYASNSCYYTTNKLFIGKSNSYIEFPAISGKKLTKVTITPNSGTGGASLTICHKDSTVATPGGASQSLSYGSSTAKVWTLTHTTANTAYKVLLGGGKNAHITSWSLEYTNVGGGSGSTNPTGFLNQVFFLSSYFTQLMVISRASRR